MFDDDVLHLPDPSVFADGTTLGAGVEVVARTGGKDGVLLPRVAAAKSCPKEGATTAGGGAQAGESGDAEAGVDVHPFSVDVVPTLIVDVVPGDDLTSCGGGLGLRVRARKSTSTAPDPTDAVVDVLNIVSPAPASPAANTECGGCGRWLQRSDIVSRGDDGVGADVHPALLLAANGPKLVIIVAPPPKEHTSKVVAAALEDVQV